MKANTARIREGIRCSRCGWPIILMVKPPYNMWDWWMYCSNKGCEHHEGEGVFQDTPDWIVEDK